MLRAAEEFWRNVRAEDLLHKQEDDGDDSITAETREGTGGW